MSIQTVYRPKYWAAPLMAGQGSRPLRFSGGKRNGSDRDMRAFESEIIFMELSRKVHGSAERLSAV